MPKTACTSLGETSIRMRRRALLAATAIVMSGVAAGAFAQATAPDLIIYNANILTVDKAFSTAHAAAIKGSKFTAVGADAAVLATAGPQTVKVDMHGKTVLPSFTDSHVHVLSGKNFTTAVDLTHVTSIKEMQEAIAARARTKKPGEWVDVTRGWWNFDLKEKRNPTKADLDAAAPNNPVALQVTHFAIVNSAALKALGITRDTPNPPGGIIEKDPKTGEPNGILFDKAGNGIRRLMPQPDPQQAYEGVAKVIQRLNSQGITDIREMGGTKADAALYKKLLADGRLTVRVEFCYNVSPALPAAELEKALTDLGPPGEKAGDGMFLADCLAEVAVDGATGMTSFTRADYPTKPGYRGIQMNPQAQYNMFTAMAAKYGWRLAAHSSGDAGIDETLEAYEKAGAAGHRWSIEHGNTMRPDQWPKIKELGLVVNSQYAHLSEGGLKTLEGYGQALSDQTQRFKDWLANGIEFSSGSDGPISYKAEPLFWMYGLVTRQTDWGGVIGPDQGITREQAIRSFTSIPARNTFEEDVKGTIEPGKYADFAVVSLDVMNAPIEQVKTGKVLATVLGGKTVYGDLAAAATAP